MCAGKTQTASGGDSAAAIAARAGRIREKAERPGHKRPCSKRRSRQKISAAACLRRSPCASTLRTIEFHVRLRLRQPPRAARGFRSAPRQYLGLADSRRAFGGRHRKDGDNPARSAVETEHLLKSGPRIVTYSAISAFARFVMLLLRSEATLIELSQNNNSLAKDLQLI